MNSATKIKGPLRVPLMIVPLRVPSKVPPRVPWSVHLRAFKGGGQGLLGFRNVTDDD